MESDKNKAVWSIINNELGKYNIDVKFDQIRLLQI